MAGIEPGDFRISDAERESALSALGEHMSSGRLDVNEYGDRSAEIATAKTRRDLLALFTDLPEPHPRFDLPPAPAGPAAPTQRAFGPTEPPSDPVHRWEQRPVAQRMAGALVPLAGIIAVILFFALHLPWLVFLLPAAVMLFSGALFGDGWRQDRRAYQRARRDRQRAHRRRGRYY